MWIICINHVALNYQIGKYKTALRFKIDSFVIWHLFALAEIMLSRIPNINYQSCFMVCNCRLLNTATFCIIFFVNAHISLSQTVIDIHFCKLGLDYHIAYIKVITIFILLQGNIIFFPDMTHLKWTIKRLFSDENLIFMLQKINANLCSDNSVMLCCVLHYSMESVFALNRNPKNIGIVSDMVYPYVYHIVNCSWNK